MRCDISRPANGTKRIVTKFLLFPKCINGECRWLEKATYEQVYDCGYGNYDDWTYWCDVRWINE